VSRYPFVFLVFCFSFFGRASEVRTPIRWPLPQNGRAIASQSGLRIQAYRNYVSSLTDSELREFLEDARINTGSLGFKPGKVLVKFADDFVEQAIVEDLKANQKGFEVRSFKSGSTKELVIPSEKTNLQTLADLAALKELTGVVEVYPNYKIKKTQIPNDPLFSDQYALKNEGENRGVADADIDGPEAWQVTTGSREVLVGVIDTGIDYNHPDLASNIWMNPGETGLDSQGRNKASNGIDDDGNGYVDDFRGWNFVEDNNDPIDYESHGTHVAGTIGAVGNNAVGIAGVAWNVSLVPLQILDMFGSGEISAAIRAVEYATQMNIPITNNSYGALENVPAFEEAIKANRDAGFLFIAAAGNMNSNNDERPFFPASYPVENIISVASTNKLDKLSSFSNFGTRSVHLAAPGEEILSIQAQGTYWRLSGTSMAAPHVAGAAALIKSIQPNWNYVQIKEKILSSVDVLESESWTNKVSSRGRLNVARAVDGVASPIPLRLVLSSIIPSVGPLEGGARVTVKGIDFSPQAQVLIGSRSCSSVNYVSKYEINCVLPPGRPVVHNVIVTNPDGLRKTLVNAFLYHPEPKINSISPERGPRKAGNTLTINGTNFSSGSKVKIGSMWCLNPEVISSEQIRCRLPEQTFGSYPVQVENNKGQLSQQNVRYFYFAQPEIELLVPVSGALKGGNQITIRGRDYQIGAKVTVGGKACSRIQVVSDQAIRCIVPKGNARGSVPVRVTNLNGQKSGPASYQYR